MSISTWFYLFDVLDNLSGVLFAIIFFYFVIFIVGGIFVFIVHCNSDGDDEIPRLTAVWRKFYNKLWLALVLILLNCAIPSKNTMYMMLSTSKLQQSNLPQKVVEVLQLKLDNVISDFKKAQK